jgi:hypothetical protein
MIQTIIPPAPVHPLSSLVTVVIDMLWGIIELGATLSVAGLISLLPLIVTCGLTCFLSVTLTQHYVDRDDWGASISKGFALGILAAVPYPVTGTIAGVVLLGWAGIQVIETKIREFLLTSSR